MQRSTRPAGAAALALLFACGGAAVAPSAPAPGMDPGVSTVPDPDALAAELDQRLAELAAIVHAHRTDCPRLAAELRAVVARMEVTVQRAREAQDDPSRARELTRALRSYDAIAAERTASIEADFAADPSCIADPEVRQVLGSMPTL